jgi:peptide-methionine (S)-S-oxide reductase
MHGTLTQQKKQTKKNTYTEIFAKPSDSNSCQLGRVFTPRAADWDNPRSETSPTLDFSLNAALTRRSKSTTMKIILATILAAGALNLAAVAQPTNLMTTNKIETATLGGGCFWCMEAVYERLPGVLSVTSGFAGGHTVHPTYQEVCTGTTGHAEVTQITFDPAKISYDQLLTVFWQAHDPTTLNRQGADEGTQYRSIILYHDEKQKLIAEKSRLDAQSKLFNPIVTEIVPFTKFYPAEDHHQGYYDAHAGAPYCQAVIAPKLEKLEHKKAIEPTVQTPK